MSTRSQALLDAFEARLVRQGMAPGTIRKYRQGVGDFIHWLGDDRDPATVRRADVEEYLDTLRLGPATIRGRIAAIKKMYEYLDSKGLLVDRDGRELRNPVEHVERPRSRRRPNDWLNDEEDRAMMRSVVDAREGAVLSLMRWGGLRVGEACGLTWADVDLDNRELRVRESKSDSGIRTVPVLPQLDRALRRWRAYLKQKGRYDPRGPVLATSRRDPRTGLPTAMKPAFAWRVTKRVAERAGVRARPATDKSGWNLSTVTDHTLRRTFATDLLNRGVRIEIVSCVLGHSDTRVTTQHYAELLDATVASEIERAFEVAS